MDTIALVGHDKLALSEQDVKNGSELIDGLISAGLPVQLAGWLRRATEARYIFCIASPNVQAFDPRIVYKLIARIITDRKINLSSSDIYVAPTTNLSIMQLQNFSEIIAGEGLAEERIVHRAARKLRAADVNVTL